MRQMESEVQLLFRGMSGRIEAFLREEASKPLEQQMTIVYDDLAEMFECSRSLLGVVYRTLEKVGVDLPPNLEPGRPRTRTPKKPTRHNFAVTGDENDEVTQKIRSSLDEGLTYREIEEMGYGKGQVQYRVQLGFASRQHNRHSPEEVDLFDSDVERLLQSGQQLTYSGIAEQLEPKHPGTTYFRVYNSTQRLKKQGRIEIPGTQEGTLL